MKLTADNIKDILLNRRDELLKEGVEEVNCKGMKFDFFVDLSGILFTGRVDFSGAIFREGVSFEGAKFFTNGADVLFVGAFFESSENGVSFENAEFGKKDISSESLRKQGIFTGNNKNTGQVSFEKAKFGAMDGEKPLLPKMGVKFSGVRFFNAGGVDFSYAAFSNAGRVNFFYATFSNAGRVNFSNAAFSNAGWVNFYNATFSNAGWVGFLRTIWVNERGLTFDISKFKEESDLIFDECLFLSKDEISFKKVKFPQKGSVKFQRCYFAGYDYGFKDDIKVDFSEAKFIEAAFEGGEIGWIKELLKEGKIKDTSIEELFKAIKKPVPDWAKGLKVPENTPVFDEEAVISFKDLTINSAKNLSFRCVNLSKAQFDGLTLSHIQLNAPEWYKYEDKGMPFYRIIRWLLPKKIKLERNILYAEKEFNAIAKTHESYERKRKDVEDQYTQLKNNLETKRDFVNAGHFYYGEMEMRYKGLSWLKRFCGLTSFYRGSCGYGERPLRAFVVTLFLIGVFTSISLKAQSLFGLDWGFWKTAARFLTPYSWAPVSVKSVGDPELGGAHWWLIFAGKLLIYTQTILFVLAVRRRFKR